MEFGELYDYMAKARKNPHFVETLDQKELYDFMSHLQTEYLSKSDFIIGVYNHNESLQTKTLEEFLEGQPDIKRIKSVFEQVEFQYNKRNNPAANEHVLLDFEFTEGQQKIIFLEKIGVIDFLRKEFGNPSNSKLGEILKPVTGLKPDTIRKYLERIGNNETSEGAESAVLSIISQLKLKRVKRE
jgi:hypothetical protein